MKDFATIDTAAETVSNSMNAIRAYKSAGDNDSDKPNPPSESYLVEADRAKISQVVSNLLSNAVNSIKARDNTEQGKISISVIKNNEMIISVKDNGLGITPEVPCKTFHKVRIWF